MESPAPILVFLSALTEKAPGLKPQVEPGGEKAGNWWIDIPAEKPITIEWRPDQGFGLSFRETEGYGESPDEVFRTPARAAHRVAQILKARSAGEPTGLRAIRELYGVTQKQIAGRLKQQQGAVSKLEKRRDVKIETIDRFVRALGGHMEIQAVFPDGRLPIYAVKKVKTSSHATTKSRRLARA